VSIWGLSCRRRMGKDRLASRVPLHRSAVTRAVMPLVARIGGWAIRLNIKIYYWRLKKIIIDMYVCLAYTHTS
jgi:hypothetical protein